jgi:hypothetical protein
MITGAALIVAGTILVHTGWSVNSKHDEDLGIPVLIGTCLFTIGVIVSIVAGLI